MVDPATGTVVGEICHIKARSSGGPRYDATQSESDRDAYENLLLLCPSHHTLVDSAAATYTVETLVELKQRHVERGVRGPEISDEIAERLAAAATVVVGGSVITTINQRGGQVAHQIVNLGPPRRSISAVTREEMIQILRVHRGSRIGFASTQGDTEADNFKRQLMETFGAAGWEIIDCATFMFFGTRHGLVVTIPFSAPEAGLPQVVMRALSLTGEPLAGNRGDMANDVGLYVQVWSARVQ